MKIITLSDTECGGKPTAYAAVLYGTNAFEIQGHVRRALVENWRYGEDAASGVANDDELLHNLKSCGFSWIKERILVEITEVYKFDNAQEKQQDGEVFMIGLNGGAVRIAVGDGPLRSNRNYYERVVRDAMRFYLL